MWKKVIKYSLPYGITSKYFLKDHISGDPNHPRVFNEVGKEMVVMYLADYRAKQYSLMSGRYPSTVLWDRGNKSLKLQMYSHMTMFNRVPRQDGMRQFGLLQESESICPNDYLQALKNADEIKSLDTLFTFSERMLDKYCNAKMVIANGVWYGTELYGGEMRPDNYERKTKLISIVASAKQMTPLHLFRAETARELKRRGLADAMGTSVGEYFDKISDAFDDYRYNVAIENDATKYYFTEKVLDCFASMTVPVYFGATEIGHYFNEDGIIQIKEPTIECVLETIKQCSEQDYSDRQAAIIDNFNRVQHYLTIEDYLTENYMNLFKFDK